MAPPTLSIIIPTASANQVLEPLLASIETQELPAHQFEVLLIYNGRKPPKTLCTQLKNVRTFYSPNVGVNQARNLGIINTKGSIIYFLDDDCRLFKKNHLQQIIQQHQEHPHTIGIGGPYEMSALPSFLQQAYHTNMRAWLTNRAQSECKTDVLLGGNASYKKDAFRDTRFPPGIRYGGSETPLNLQLASLHGPHVFVPALGVRHQSPISLLKFIKKSYLQGMGAAFIEKFYPKNAKQDALHPSTPTNVIISALISLYDFCFMVGYRTSIYERRHPLLSISEEFFLRNTKPLIQFISDIHATLRINSIPTTSPLLPKCASIAKNPIPINGKNTLAMALKKMTPQDLAMSYFYIESKKESPFALSPDQLTKNLQNVNDFYSIEAANIFSFKTAPLVYSLDIHHNSGFVILFDSHLSNKYHHITDIIESLNTLSPQNISENQIYEWIGTNESTQRKKLQRYIDKTQPTHFLDAVAVPQKTWDHFLLTYNNHVNHFTWNQFVKNENILIKNLNQSVQYQWDHLQSHAQEYFFSQPNIAFYRSHFSLLGKNPKRRALFLLILSKLHHLYLKPQSHWMQTLYEQLNQFLNSVDSLYVETCDISLSVYKICFCYLHRSFWKIYGPTFGFMALLFELPETIRNQPLPTRLKVGTTLFFRRWGWLFLKTVGRR